MPRRLTTSLIALTVVLAPAGAVVDRTVVANEALTQPRLRKFFNGPFVVTAQTVGANGKEELFIALSNRPKDGWRVTRLPLPPGQRRGDPSDAVVASEQPLCVLYVGAIGNPQQIVPVWRWEGAGPWTVGRSTGPGDEAANRIINSVAVGDTVGKVVYAAGSEVVPPGARSLAQIWRSTDGGLNWSALCEGGALKPEPQGAVIATPTAPGTWLGGPSRATIGVGSVLRPWARIAYLDETVLGLNGSGTIWGRFGSDRALKIERERPIYLSPPFEGCVAMKTVSAPLPLAVWAYWWKDAVLSPRRYLSWTDDNGESWGHRSIDPKMGARAIPVVGECLVDFHNMTSGCVAAQVSDGAGGKAWALYWRTSKQRPEDPWQVEQLPGYHILDLQATWDGEAFMLARSADPDVLYCLHWQAVRPKVNHPPSQPTVITFVPARPTTNDNVRCLAKGSVDPDFDKVTYTYQWQKYGGGPINPALNTDVLEAKWTKPGEHWVVVVTPTDGKLTGIPAVGQVDIAP